MGIAGGDSQGAVENRVLVFQGSIFYSVGCWFAVNVGQVPKKPISAHAVLVRDLTDATLRVESATMQFNAVTSDIPSYIPQPDGTQRIHNASRALKAARDEMIAAHNRLNAFLERGIVPKDLKRSG